MLSTCIYALALAAAVSLAACSGPPPATGTANDETPVGSMGAPAAPVAPDQTLPTDVRAENAATPVQTAQVAADYVGRWVGPEGLVLDVKSDAGGGLTIVNQWTLDDKGTFTGSATRAGLRFVRNGGTVVARPGDGAATGMKWLAGKRDCLTVRSGSEAYCRD